MKKRSLYLSAMAILFLAVVLPVFSVFAAQKTENNKKAVAKVSIKLSKKTLKVKKKKSKVLKVKKLKGGKKVTWTVTDKSVVRFKKSGKSIWITGKKNGITAIIASCKKQKAVCKVIVGKGGPMNTATKKALGIKTTTEGNNDSSIKNSPNIKKDVPEPEQVSVPKLSPDEFGNALASMISTYDAGLDSQEQMEQEDYVTKRLIVKSSDDFLNPDTYGAIAAIRDNSNHYILQFATVSATRKAAEVLLAAPSTEYVEADQIDSVAIDVATGITSSPVQILGSSPGALSWGISAIGADKYAAYLKEHASGSVTVAVIDNGVDATHPYLKGRVLSTGFDFIDSDSDPGASNGAVVDHGTHVAGIIAGCTNGLNVNILPIRIFDNDGRSKPSLVAAGIQYAADHGADIINLSFTGPHSDIKDDMVNEAISRGITVVSAAGNDHLDVSKKCPAHIGNVITVAALDSDKQISSGSNYGDAVDVAAPGVKVNSSIANNKYGSLSGTSQAAPHVAAEAAMLKLSDSSLTPAKIEQMIKSNTVDLGVAGWDRYYGFGLPDMTKFMPEETAISLDKTVMTMAAGDLGRLTVSSQESIPAGSITWTSSDENLLLVEDGYLRALHPGSVTVTANYGGKKASCSISITSQKMQYGQTDLIYGFTTAPGTIDGFTSCEGPGYTQVNKSGPCYLTLKNMYLDDEIFYGTYLKVYVLSEDKLRASLRAPLHNDDYTVLNLPIVSYSDYVMTAQFDASELLSSCSGKVRVYCEVYLANGELLYRSYNSGKEGDGCFYLDIH